MKECKQNKSHKQLYECTQQITHKLTDNYKQRIRINKATLVRNKHTYFEFIKQNTKQVQRLSANNNKNVNKYGGLR